MPKLKVSSLDSSFASETLTTYLQPNILLSLTVFWILGHVQFINGMWIFSIFLILNRSIIIEAFNRMAHELTGYVPSKPVSQSFKMNPETETPLFINQLLGIFWEKCMRPLLRYEIKDFINKKMASFPNLYKYIYPRLTKLDVDMHPPFITGIKFYDSSLKECPGLNQSILVDVGIRIKCVSNMKCRIWRQKWSYFGLRYVQIDSLIRVRILPLLRALDKNDPINSLGDTQVSFLSPIELDYEFNGLLEFLNNVVIKTILRKIIYIASAFVSYPQYMGFKKPRIFDRLANQLGLHPTSHGGPIALSLKPSTPICLMRVRVLEGENLKRRFYQPVLCFRSPKINPFVILSLSELNNHEALPPVSVSSNPKWKILSEIPLLERDIKFRELLIGIMDDELSFSGNSRPNPLGFTTIDIKKAYASGSTKAFWYHLGEGSDARIKVSLDFFPLSKQPPRQLTISNNPRIHHAVLVLLVHRVFTSQKCRPLVSIQVTGRSAVNTSFGHFCNVYEFSEEFIFPIYFVGTDKVCIQVQDAFANERIIASASKSLLGLTKRILIRSEDANEAMEHSVYAQEGALPDSSELHQTIAESSYPIFFFNGKNQVLELESFDGHSVKLSIVGKTYFVRNH